MMGKVTEMLKKIADNPPKGRLLDNWADLYGMSRNELEDDEELKERMTKHLEEQRKKSEEDFNLSMRKYFWEYLEYLEEQRDKSEESPDENK